MQKVRGNEIPAEYLETPTVTIVCENIHPFTEDADGTTYEGYEWDETRFTPAETSAVKRGDTLGLAQQSGAMRKVYLRGKLSETDYVIAKIAEAEGDEAQALRREYADIIAQRRSWRSELNGEIA